MTKTRVRITSFLTAAVLFIVPAGAAGSLRVQEMKNSVSSDQLKYECSFPRLSGLNDDMTEQKLNVRFKEMAVTSQKTAEFAARKLSGTGAVVNGNYHYLVKRNENGILSLCFVDTLQAGGANSMTIETAVSIDTVSGKVYKLSDLFLEKADYIGMISAEVKKQMKQKNLEKDMLSDFKEIKRNQDFYLTNDALVVFFQQYEYFPHSYGIQEFAIPLKSLDGILKPDYRQST